MSSCKLVLHEAALLLRLTAPLVLAQVSQTAMGFVDTVMAGRYSAVDLAAVAVGSSIFFPVYLFLIGLLSAVTPLVAQANGRSDHDGIRQAIRRGMGIGLLVGLALMPVLWSMRPCMVWMGVSAEVIPITMRFLFAISWGLPLGGLFFALRNGGDGLAKPRLSMIAGFAGLLTNILANYLLIYGKLGLPELGGAGCGWASTLAILTMLLCMSWLLGRSRIKGTQNLLVIRRVADPAQGVSTTTFLRLGIPLGLALFVECSIFTIIALFVAKFGAQVVAAHQIALNFASQLYMLPYSLGMALTVRIGFTIGQGRIRRLRRIMATGLSLAFTGSILTCLLILGYAETIATMYTTDAAVQALAVSLLLYAAIFQIPDAIQVNCGGILRGCKDSRIPLALMLLAYWGIGLPLGYTLGLGRFGGLEPGPQGFWLGLIAALTAAAGLLGWRMLVMLRQLEKGRTSAFTASRP